jgi:hypothetical protein
MQSLIPTVVDRTAETVPGWIPAFPVVTSPRWDRRRVRFSLSVVFFFGFVFLCTI